LDVLGLDKGDLRPDYFVEAKEKIWAENLWKGIKGKKKRIVAVGKGSNKLKEWPKAQDLFSNLRNGGYRLLRIDEDGKAKWSFRRAAALVATADLVISPDTGISNLAGALDVPVVTIFSNRNGENFVKMYSSMRAIQGHCPHRKVDFCDFFCPCFGGGPHRPKENRAVPDCLKRLKTEEVYNVVKELLK